MTSPAFRSSRFLISLTLLFLGIAVAASGQAVQFADGLEYNNFYAVTVNTVDGEQFSLFDVASFEGENSPWPDANGSYGDRPGAAPDGMNYFLWVRRAGDRGAITYPLAFSKIKEIRFAGPYGGLSSDPAFSGTLLSDESEEVSREVTYREDGRRFSGWFFPKELEPQVPSYTPALLVLTSVDENGINLEQKVWLKTDGFLGGIDEDFGTYAMLWLRHDGVDTLEFRHDGRYERCPVCGSIFFDDRYENCPFDDAVLIGQQ